MAVLPPLVIAALVGGVNDWRFGSPWRTGYEGWRPEIHAWNGSVADGVLGFLIDPQRSVFLCFPPLIGAAFGFRRFLRAHPVEAVFLGATFVVFLFGIGLLPSWRGEWSYGPRYLVFLLPALSLPCLTFFDGLNGWRPAPRHLARAVTVAVVAASVFLQVEVNRLWFFTYYVIREPIRPALDGEAARYLREMPFGWINFDLVRARDDFGRLPYVRTLATKGYSEGSIALYEQNLQKVAGKSNYFWPIAGDLPPADL